MTYREISGQLAAYLTEVAVGDLVRQTRADLAKDAAGLFTAKKLHELNSSYQLYPPDIWQLIIQAAGQARQSQELLAKTVLLYHIFALPASLKKDELIGLVLASFAAPDQNGAPLLAGVFAPLVALLPAAPAMVAAMKKRQLPEQIIRETLSEFHGKVMDFQLRLGRPGSRTYVGWLKRFTDGDIVRIGRFNMEMKREFTGKISVFKDRQDNTRILMKDVLMHRTGYVLGCAGLTDEAGSFQADLLETNEYFLGFPVGPDGKARPEKIRLDKQEWRQVLTTGDAAISVHIPAWLSLDEDYCRQSYARTRQVMAEHYPEYTYQAIYCQSWMIDPQLATLLGQATSITRFQQHYLPYPT